MTTDLRSAGDRIAELLDDLHARGDPRAAAEVDEVLRLVTDLYGAALAVVVDAVTERAPELLEVMVGDDLVASLLVVHDLHPQSLRRRVEGALASVRPMLAAHGGGVELVDVDQGTGALRLRLSGSCDGCPSSALTLRNAVEAAIVAAAPDVTAIAVDEPAAGTPVTIGTKPAFDSCPAGVGAP